MQASEMTPIFLLKHAVKGDLGDTTNWRAVLVIVSTIVKLMVIVIIALYCLKETVTRVDVAASTRATSGEMFPLGDLHVIAARRARELGGDAKGVPVAFY